MSSPRTMNFDEYDPPTGYSHVGFSFGQISPHASVLRHPTSASDYGAYDFNNSMSSSRMAAPLQVSSPAQHQQHISSGAAFPTAVHQPGLKFESPLHSPSTSSTTNHSHRPTSTGNTFVNPLKRPRHAIDDSESPPDTGDASPVGTTWAGQGAESRIGVKRACNECRQQKLKCTVQQDPFKPCDRCEKHKIPCCIDPHFKRIGKRKKNAEMEQENSTLHNALSQKDNEIAALRNQVLALQSMTGSQPFSHNATHLSVPPNMDSKFAVPRRRSAVRDMVALGDAADAMMDLRNQGSPGPGTRVLYTLGSFSMSVDQANSLFDEFFRNYHPFLPLMNQARGTSFFYKECPLLFWVIMATAMRKTQTDLLIRIDDPLRRMLWSTISDFKQHYLVVKALATICTWPLPVSSSDADPTPILCGFMVQLATSIGLHRPSHAQDFSRYVLELRSDELRDRYYTWAACNIVAQRVSTGYGLPPNTMYDWTLTLGEGKELSFSLPEDVKARLKIEMFANEVSTKMYGWQLDPLGIASPERKRLVTTELDKKLDQLGRELGTANSINCLYLRAARLHYHLSALFDTPSMMTEQEYLQDLDKLWQSTREFADAAINIQSPMSLTDPIIQYGTNYIFQMLLASGFILLKLCNSFYASHIDREEGREMFAQIVSTLRTMGVMTNDLPARLSEVLAQLWRVTSNGTRAVADDVDHSLELKVRSRMSMSLIHDSIWRWKELRHVENNDEARTAALSGSTDPEAIDTGSYPFTSGGNSSLAPPADLVNMRRSPTPVSGDRGWGELFSNDVFDPTNWLLSGVMTDFPGFDNDSSYLSMDPM